VSSLPFDESNTFTPPSAFGPYRVLHQIGSGVLGPVFRTYDPQSDRLVAVKAFRLDLLPEDVARLAGELRALVGTAGYLAAGLEGTTAYLAMDYYAAETLDVALRHLAPAPLETALPILRAMAEAVDNAWKAGAAFGHGSLHPRDVFVTPGTGELHITGFGIAPALEAIGGRPPLRRPYTSPERAAGASWDIRADVYSLGAIAHELLTGRRPAGPGEQDGALPASMAPEVRVQIRRVLSKALAELPTDRFASGREFIEALADPAAMPAPAPVPDEPTVDAEAPAGPRAGETDQAVLADALAAVSMPPPAPRRPRSRAVTPLQRPVMRSAPPESRGVAAEDLPLPAGAPIDAGDVVLRTGDDLRVASEAPARTAIGPAALSLPPPYPWGAFAAACVACLILGAAGGYQFALRRGEAPAAPATVTPPPSAAPKGAAAPSAAPAAGDTEVAVADTPPAPAGNAPAAKPPVQPARPAVLPGRVLVRSAPEGATVTIDGKPAGRTPLTARDLALGAHSIVLSHAGFASQTHHVSLTRRAPSSTINVTLKVEGAARVEAPVRGAAAASLAVDSRPRGAHVTIDGRAIGVTPLTAAGLAPGVHSVRVELAGYRPVTTKVTVKAGEAARLAVTLEQR